MTELITAASAVLAIVVTLVIYGAGQRRTRHHYLETLWDQILRLAQDHPELCDISRTANYLSVMSWQERLSYDATCLNAWSVLNEAAAARLVNDGRMKLALEWIAGFHSEWLLNNAQLFTNPRFWKVVDRVLAQEPRIIRHRPVPSTAGVTTWDELSSRYFDTVFSPFDPRMQSRALPDAIAFNLSTLAAHDPVVVVDVGCGPGNLISLLGGLVPGANLSYIGIDSSSVATELAQSRADTARFPCRIVQTDIRDNAGQFVGDLVVGINIVLGASRDENVELLTSIGHCLRGPESRLILLLPSFETVLHIDELRYQYYANHYDEKHAERARHSYRRWKSPDPATASYVDDGVTRQYFHSLDSIATELPLASLSMVGQPTKLRYPWELARYFDYGYFPSAEPVWDWLVVCARNP